MRYQGDSTTVTYTLTPIAGAHGTISPSDPFQISSGASATFTATPDPGYVVSQWLANGLVLQTGGNSLTANFGGNFTVEVTFVPETATYTAVSASFTGLLNGDFGSHGYGKITMQTTARGRITGRVLADGVNFRFSGTLSPSGSFAKGLQAINGTAVAGLNVSLQNDGTFNGTWVEEVGPTYAIAGEKNATGTVAQPLAQKGRYTARLLGENITPGGGSVRGYVLARVGVNGATSFIGSLPDGTKLSGGSRVSISGGLPVVFGLYQARRGYLFGSAVIAGAGNARLPVGVLRWTKPPQSRGIYQSGITDATIVLLGHVWTPPAAGARLVPDFDAGGGNMLVTLTRGDLADDIAKVTNLTTANVVVAIPRTAERLKLLVTRSTGRFSGSFLHSDGRTRTIRGAFVQDPGGASVSEGYFPGVTVPGLVTITVP